MLLNSALMVCSAAVVCCALRSQPAAGVMVSHTATNRGTQNTRPHTVHRSRGMLQLHTGRPAAAQQQPSLSFAAPASSGQLLGCSSPCAGTTVFPSYTEFCALVLAAAACGQQYVAKTNSNCIKCLAATLLPLRHNESASCCCCCWLRCC
jgi:hypothetical protein